MATSLPHDLKIKFPTKYKPTLITSEAQVPDGYKRLALLTPNNHQRTLLSSAHRDGAIPSVKLMRSISDHTGPVYLEEAASRIFLAECAAREQALLRGISAPDMAVTHAPVDTPPNSPSQPLGGATTPDHLGRIADNQERIIGLLEQLLAVWAGDKA